MDYMKRYEAWLNAPVFDEATKEELRSLAGNAEEIEDRFYKDLEFGTAGLRGVIGAGTNRMNYYTIRQATQGLANYILKQNGADRGVAIAYDSRRMSPEFADAAALCLAANQIKAYVFESLRPTPELSYAVRKLGCIAGINITASHNPPEYNGYKVYWEDGAQITPPHDAGITASVRAVTDYSACLTMEKEDALAKGLYQVIGADIDDPYIEELKKVVLHQDAIDAAGGEMTIVYSPLHGTGNIPARRVLRELGFANVYVVPEQELPDGEFPTVSYPNPEAAEAFTLGLKLAEKVKADLVLATDPDADRLGVLVRDREGNYHTLTGNQSACLLAEYELSERAKISGLPEDGFLVTTIVSTNLAAEIAKAYDVDVIECLTGFKYIGQQILKAETTGVGTYLFGFEESYGCLLGTHARDKDAIVATMALCECAAFYRTKGMTLWDAMLSIYEKYGYYTDMAKSVTMQGIEGLERIRCILEDLRKDPPKAFGGYSVLRVRDYEADTITDLATGAVTPTGLPASNVLYYELNDGAWVCVRPSGTEPKIKCYLGVKGASFEESRTKADALAKEVMKYMA